MSDQTIRAGDLVYVLRCHCVHTLAGLPKTVRAVTAMPEQWMTTCMHCGVTSDYSEPFAEIEHKGRVGWAPVSWLKKIPPLSEPDHVEHKEEITA